MDMTYGDPPVVLGRRELVAGDFSAQQWSRHVVTFETTETTMGVEFRVHSRGRLSFAARAFVDVRPADAPFFTPRRPEGRARGWVLLAAARKGNRKGHPVAPAGALAGEARARSQLTRRERTAARHGLGLVAAYVEVPMPGSSSHSGLGTG